MHWKLSGIPSLQIGGRCVPLSTLWLKDKWGQKRRFRIRTVHGSDDRRTSRSPSWSQLAKDEKGRIGVLVVGYHRSGWLKVGSSEKMIPYLFAPLDALAKKVRKKLLIPLDYELVEEEDAILAREKESCPWYVASKNSHLFHESGCWQAKRIKDNCRMVFKTREQALRSGYTPHKSCGG